MSRLRKFLGKETRFLEHPLDIMPRVLLIVSALLLAFIYFLPLWSLTMVAQQYPNGLRLNIYSYKLVGGNGGQDVKEINVLNHYIGMKPLVAEDFTEFKWIPFVVGAIALLFLRAVVMGKVSNLVDVVVLFLYFGVFSLWSFAYKMYSYGHTLAPEAAIKVKPFTPPLFGYQKIANFEIYSYPGAASYALGAVAIILAVAVFLTFRATKSQSARELEGLT
ncbi:MAG: hypothetical protein ACXW2P_04520 [Thermoanaerobaculia bacterium]